MYLVEVYVHAWAIVLIPKGSNLVGSLHFCKRDETVLLLDGEN